MKRRRECEICRGEGSIRLPIYRRMSLVADVPSISSAEETSRRYPCPECSETVPQDRIAVMSKHHLVQSGVDDPDFMGHVRRHSAHELIDGLLHRKLISFERGRDDPYEMTFPIIATVGVVSPNVVATLEQRVAERQDEVAREVAAAAAAGIRIWGSHYTGDEGSIHKAQAVDAVNEALKRVLEKRAQGKAA